MNTPDLLENIQRIEKSLSLACWQDGYTLNLKKTLQAYRKILADRLAAEVTSTQEPTA